MSAHLRTSLMIIALLAFGLSGCASKQRHCYSDQVEEDGGYFYERDGGYIYERDGGYIYERDGGYVYERDGGYFWERDFGLGGVAIVCRSGVRVSN